MSRHARRDAARGPQTPRGTMPLLAPCWHRTYRGVILVLAELSAAWAALFGAGVGAVGAVAAGVLTTRAGLRDAERQRDFEATQRADERADQRAAEHARYRDDWHRELRSQMFASAAEFSGHLGTAVLGALTLRDGEIQSELEVIKQEVEAAAKSIGRLKLLFGLGHGGPADTAATAQLAAENMLNPLKSLAAFELAGSEMPEEDLAALATTRDEASQRLREFDLTTSEELWRLARQPNDGSTGGPGAAPGSSDWS